MSASFNRQRIIHIYSVHITQLFNLISISCNQYFYLYHEVEQDQQRIPSNSYPITIHTNSMTKNIAFISCLSSTTTKKKNNIVFFWLLDEHFENDWNRYYYHCHRSSIRNSIALSHDWQCSQTSQSHSTLLSWIFNKKIKFVINFLVSFF